MRTCRRSRASRTSRFSRDAVVAIALREWRLFGSPVDDDPPGSYRPATPEDKPERQQGLWQRVGEYWWLAMNAGAPEAAWTGKHDANGAVFPASEDGDYAWSAAFVSYVMRIAGAGAHFPYSASHSDYINHRQADDAGPDIGLADRPPNAPESYAPQPGDLICLGRGSAHDLRYDDLPAGHFPGHCDIVVDTSVPGQISVVGGNVDDAVTLKHVPVTPDGKLATPDGQVLDTALSVDGGAAAGSRIACRVTHRVGAGGWRTSCVERIHLASANTRERVMNRTPSAASSEKLSPPSGTTSMVSWLFAQ